MGEVFVTVGVASAVTPENKGLLFCIILVSCPLLIALSSVEVSTVEDRLLIVVIVYCTKAEEPVVAASKRSGTYIGEEGKVVKKMEGRKDGRMKGGRMAGGREGGMEGGVREKGIRRKMAMKGKETGTEEW